MQNPTKEKETASVVVLQAVDGKSGILAYEDNTGGFLTNSLARYYENHAQYGNLTFAEVFANVKKDVRTGVSKHGLQQTPKMDVYGSSKIKNALFCQTMKEVKRVVVVAPVYPQARLEKGRKTQPLPGATRDVCDLLAVGHQVFHPECEFTILANVNSHFYPDLRNLEVLECTQEAAKRELEKAFMQECPTAIFWFGHGNQGDNNGHPDQYMVFNETDVHVPQDLIWGLDIARWITQKLDTGKGFVFYVSDSCHSYELPGKEDMEKAAAERQTLVVARGGCGQMTPIKSFREQVQVHVHADAHETVRKFTHLKVAGYQIGSMAYAVEGETRRVVDQVEGQVLKQMYSAQELDGLCGALGSSLPLPFFEEEYPSEPTAPELIEAAVFTQGHLDEPREDNHALLVDQAGGAFQARGIPAEIVENIAMISQDVLSKISLAWDGLETACGYLFGAGVFSLMTPILIAMFLVTAGAALCLYLNHMRKHQGGTVATMLVVMAVTTLLPYLCDPVALQSFLSAENAICFGLVCTGASFVVLLLSVAFNWGRLSTQVSALFKATNLAGKYSLIARLALELHLMGGGRKVQQTIHVQVGGVQSFVMFYPLRANATHESCAVKKSNGKFTLLPEATGFTVLGKKLDDGSKADLTCDWNVFLGSVRKHTQGRLENIRYWSFDYERNSIDFQGLLADSQYVETFFKMNSTDSENDPVQSKLALMDRLAPVWTENSERFHIQLPTLTKKSPPTTLEWLAAPVLFAVEKLVGTPRSAPHSREL